MFLLSEPDSSRPHSRRSLELEAADGDKETLAVPECAPLHRCLRRRRKEGGREEGKWHKQALYSVASRWQYDYKENNGGHIH